MQDGCYIYIYNVHCSCLKLHKFHVCPPGAELCYRLRNMNLRHIVATKLTWFLLLSTRAVFGAPWDQMRSAPRRCPS